MLSMRCGYGRCSRSTTYQGPRQSPRAVGRLRSLAAAARSSSAGVMAVSSEGGGEGLAAGVNGGECEGLVDEPVAVQAAGVPLGQACVDGFGDDGRVGEGFLAAGLHEFAVQVLEGAVGTGLNVRVVAAADRLHDGGEAGLDGGESLVPLPAGGHAAGSLLGGGERRLRVA